MKHSASVGDGVKQAWDRQDHLSAGRADDGLHFADVHKLIEILRKLSEGGNTVVVIEHTHLDVIKTADYIIVSVRKGETRRHSDCQGNPGGSS